MITFIVAPPSAIVQAPLAGVQHPLAATVLDAVRQHGSRPVRLWRLINALANARNPEYRAMRRCWRLRYLGALGALVEARLIFRHAGLIAQSDFAIRPKARTKIQTAARRSQREHSRSPSVSTSSTEKAGSNRDATSVETLATGVQSSETELVMENLSALAHTHKTESVKPTEAEITAAARHLAQQRRKRKIWSGWLHGQRMTRLRPVVVPGGRVLPAYCVRRGLVYVLLPDAPEFARQLFDRYRERDVQVYRSPQAALLGSQKRGVRERPSNRKRASARINGAVPPRPGSRPRGRPRRSFISAG